jgi:glycosyltransferase involved in cell wall biosynthesis
VDIAVLEYAKILYIGSIFPNAQLDSLVDCCHAVDSLARSGMQVRLSIFSPSVYSEQYRSRLVIGPSVSLYDTITDDAAFFERLRSADMLLLPVNFDMETIEFIRYSMPTKVPAYLLSGTPILAYGPPEVAQMQYARDERWAHLVSERGVGNVANGIRELLSNNVLRRDLSRNAKRLAIERHDAETVRVRFQAQLTLAAYSD